MECLKIKNKKEIYILKEESLHIGQYFQIIKFNKGFKNQNSLP